MYQAYWGLVEKPFENTPDPRFLYASPQHEEGLSRLLYCVQEGKGAGMLTGVFGCGKTLLGRTLLKHLEQDLYRIAFLVHPQMSAVEVVMQIASTLGARDLPTRKTDVLANVVLRELEALLTNNAQDGKRTVVVIDEAHTIQDPAVWETFRLLLNFQWEDQFLLTLLLLGQPELKTIVDQLKPLAQRIAIRSHLTPLSAEETASYIQHRLTVAGAARPIFADDAMRLVFERSGGIPRRINHLCDLALLSGSAHQAAQIEGALIRDVAQELGG